MTLKYVGDIVIIKNLFMAGTTKNKFILISMCAVALIAFIILIFFGRMFIIKNEKGNREFESKHSAYFGEFKMIIDDRYDFNYYPKLSVKSNNKKLIVKKVIRSWHQGNKFGFSTTLDDPAGRWVGDTLPAQVVKPNQKLELKFEKLPSEESLIVNRFFAPTTTSAQEPIKRELLTSDYIMTPSVGGIYFYQITAQWDKETNKNYGSIYYVFYIEVK